MIVARAWWRKAAASGQQPDALLRAQNPEFPWPANTYGACLDELPPPRQYLPVNVPKGDRSPYGAVNMGGNVSEWCRDWYAPRGDNVWRREDPTGPPTGRSKAIRGGNFVTTRDYYLAPHVARREGRKPTRAEPDLGFRCVVPAKPRGG